MEKQKFWHWKRILVWILIIFGLWLNWYLWSGAYKEKPYDNPIEKSKSV